MPMKQWTLPTKFKSIADLAIFPLLFSDRKKSALVLEDFEILKLIKTLDLNKYTVDDIQHSREADLFDNSDHRLEISAHVNGKAEVKLAIASIILEKLGYDMGVNPPSRFFKENPIPDVSTEQDAVKFCDEMWDINGKIRAALFSWGIYQRVNGLDVILEPYWFHSDRSVWMKNYRSEMKLVFEN